MIKVMLIDDEVLVRVGLKSLINWDEYGYQIIAEASNGKEGLKLIKEKQPEIVIVDIKMPIKDGITLIKEVKDLNLNTEFIVLSSFDDFELVKKAMKLGAVDYLLKLELEEKELVNALNSAVEKAKENKSDLESNKKNKSKLEEVKKKTLHKILAGIISDQNQIKKLFENLKINLKEEKILCLTIKIKDKDVLKKFSQGDINLYEDSIINIVEEIVGDFYNSTVFMNNWGEIVVFLNLENDLETEKEKISRLNLRLHKMIKNYFSLSVTTAASSLKNNYLQLSEAFVECSECLNYSFRCVEGNAIYYQNLPQKTNLQTSEYIKNFVIEFDESLEYREIEKAVMLLKKIIAKIKQNYLSRNNAFNLYFKIAASLEKNLEQEIIGQFFESNNLYQNIDSITNNRDLISWLQILTENLKQYIDKKKDNHLILKAKKYLKHNFNQEISLEHTAKEINVSSGYLSHLFKEKSGISFTEYLNQLRISEAKKLLRNKGLKIYQIADQTGYNNPYYFSRVFKKVTGISPTEYRKSK
ncbi:response regulator transcription factor [Halanaerobium kushneri]|uniref:Stage 0 sporulation protein A homolog n=1 Tax=Halanaerobium kushneri TaxID=56779 RepID=A0A1N6ZX28_9FIRM|nr:helix-turn-helix domain-containing protein [Halanaerobium kushneri]SIR31323.1 two-component system, response regulator YesN [Halanaerobium kushneri]